MPPGSTHRLRPPAPLNAPLNARGEYIKVLLISRKGAEGIDLKNFRRAVLLEPYWNTSLEEQLEAWCPNDAGAKRALVKYDFTDMRRRVRAKYHEELRRAIACYEKMAASARCEAEERQEEAGRLERTAVEFTAKRRRLLDRLDAGE